MGGQTWFFTDLPPDCSISGGDGQAGHEERHLDQGSGRSHTRVIREKEGGGCLRLEAPPRHATSARAPQGLPRGRPPPPAWQTSPG